MENAAQTRCSHRPGLCGPHGVFEIRILLKAGGFTRPVLFWDSGWLQLTEALPCGRGQVLYHHPDSAHSCT